MDDASTEAPRFLPELPSELVEAGARENLVVLAGAGASLGAGLPSWWALVDGLLEAAKVAKPEEAKRLAEATEIEDPVKRASVLRLVMGESWLQSQLVARFRGVSPPPSPTDIHRALAQLSGVRFLTTNYDWLLEEALLQRSGRKPQVATIDDLRTISALAPGAVFKLHGDLDRPDTIVLTIRDYFHQGHVAKRAWKDRLKAYLQPPFQLLMIGYSFQDVDIQEVVNDVLGAYDGQLPGPWWLALGTTLNEALACDHGLRLVRGLNDHEQVAPWLQLLAREIDASIRANRPLAMVHLIPGAVLDMLSGSSTRGDEQFASGKYDDAISTYEEVLGSAEELLQKAAHESQEHSRLRFLKAKLQANIGLAQLNLQRFDAARQSLLQVETEALNDKPVALARIAEGLAQCGELARARSLLHDTVSRDTSVKDNEEVTAAKQMIELLDGRIPPDLLSRPMLLLRSCRVFFSQGALHDAASRAMTVFRENADNHVIALEAFAVLFVCLEETVMGCSEPSQPVPEEIRAEIVKCIDEILDLLSSQERAPPEWMAKQIHTRSIYYFHFTADGERLAAEERRFQESGWPLPKELATGADANKLAGSGQVEEAISSISTTYDPLLHALIESDLLIHAGRLDDALATARAAAVKWPNRSPIEFTLAKALRRLGRVEEALEHAQNSFRSLPARGPRLLLARCLLQTNNGEKAWELLEPLSDSKYVSTLYDRFWAAAMSGRQEAAIQIARQYLAKEPHKVEIRVRLAELLMRTGDLSEAADEAWRAYNDPRSEMLSAERLLDIGRLQQIGTGATSGPAQARIREIAEALRKRFPGSAQVESYYFQLYLALGTPPDIDPPEYQRLFDDGMVKSFAFDDVASAFTESFKADRGASALYSLGHLTIEALCSWRGWHIPRIFAWIQHVDGNWPSGLSVPISFTSSPAPPLDGVELLLGELELLVLDHLGLMPSLRNELGSAGRVILFVDVARRIAANVDVLEFRSQRVTHALDTELLGVLQRSSVSYASEKEDCSDVEFAEGKQIPIILGEELPGDANVGLIANAALVQWLFKQGHLDRDTTRRMTKNLNPSTSTLTDLPAEFAIDLSTLALFHRYYALKTLLDACGKCTIWVGPETRQALYDEQGRLGVAAADLALALNRMVAQGIKDGWIETIDRQRPEDLPPAHADDRSAKGREIIAETLSWRKALEANPRRYLLTADSLVSGLFNHSKTDLHRSLVLTVEALRRITGWVAELAQREIHLPQLVRALAPRENLSPVMHRLERLGFQYALREDELAALVRRFDSLETGEPLRILQRLEWPARTAEHACSEVARIRVAGLYADTIWKVWTDEGWSDNDRNTLTSVLLERAEILDPTSNGTVLDWLLRFVLISATSTPGTSFSGSEGGDQQRLTEDSQAGRLWRFLDGWSGHRGSRLGRLERATIDMVCELDEASGEEGPDIQESSPILLSFLAKKRTLLLFHALSILSANWKQSPLAHMTMSGRPEAEHPSASLEDILSREAQNLHPGTNGFLRPALDWLIISPATDDHPSAPIRIPPESLVLRASVTTLGELIHQTMLLLGPHDGCLYDQLAELKKHPEDGSLRRKLARHAARSPWRLVRQDPAYFATWSTNPLQLQQRMPSDLKELRALLSEPEPDPAQDTVQTFLSRFDPGGCWADRSDVQELGRQASEVPGSIAATMTSSKLVPEVYEQEVQAALSRLRQTIDQPAARLIVDISFLRIAAAKSPILELDEGTVDLRERLPELLVSVLKAESAVEHPEGMMASVEAGLLRICAKNVLGMAARSPAERPADLLWLTWRLFQWLVAQLEALSPDARLSGIESLVKIAPPPGDASVLPGDIFDPAQLGSERFNHRLASVLYALSLMEIVARLFESSDADAEESTEAKELDEEKKRSFNLVSVSSPKLEAILADLASGELTTEERQLRQSGGSCLSWVAPTSVPELALRALIMLNLDAVMRLDPEVRLRWITRYQSTLDDNQLASDPQVTSMLLLSALHAPKMTAAERVAHRACARAVLEVEPEHKSALLSLTGLLAAGDTSLVKELQAHLSDRLGDSLGVSYLGHYLAAISFVDIGQLASELRRYLDLAVGLDLDPVPLALSSARVLFHGEPTASEVIRSELKDLARSSPYREDQRMQDGLRFFGIT